MGLEQQLKTGFRNHKEFLSWFNKARKTEKQTEDFREFERLLDLGFHPPTVYFPLVVQGALMIEPTETETPETLEQFAEAMKRIVTEAAEDPDRLHAAPVATRLGRLDDTIAARKPVLTWQPEEDSDDS